MSPAHSSGLAVSQCMKMVMTMNPVENMLLFLEGVQQQVKLASKFDRDN